MDIIQYIDSSSEEKSVEYLGLLVPKVLHVSGSFALRILLTHENADFTTFNGFSDFNSLLTTMLANAEQKNGSYEIHIIPSHHTMQQLFNIQVNERPEAKAIATYLNKMLETRTPQFVGSVQFYTPTFFQQNNRDVKKDVTNTMDVKQNFQ